MKIKLKSGEVICPKCEGRGDFGYTAQVIEYEHKGTIIRIPGSQSRILCDKCQGFGKLDWVENIVGKKKPNEIKVDIETTKLIAKERKLKSEWRIKYG